MSYTTINKSTAHFNSKIYTGNGGTQSITGIGHQPDLTWIKKRDGTNYHVLTDAVRGATKQVYSNDTGAEQAVAEGLKSFDSDGFTLGTNGDTNGSGGSYVGWNWKAGTTSGITTDGNTTITPSYYSINQTAGFSILKFIGNGVTGAKLAHGLGGTPAKIVIKKIDATGDWTVYHKGMTTGYTMWWNYTQAEAAENLIYSPDATNITLSNHSSVNTNGTTYIAYCWKEVTGYSKFGSYVGNGNADGTFVYTGFKPSFVIIKKTGTGNWQLFDNKRVGYNQDNHVLRPNLSNVECTSCVEIDIISNGFKLRNTDGDGNTGSGDYIYMSIGQSLVGSNNVPCTAR